MREVIFVKQLPAAEFELMQIIWQNETPISTNQIISHMDEGVRRKPQTILTLLTRLIERGFLESERTGKERLYTPLIAREDYLTFESSQFMKRFHSNSFISLVNTLYQGNQMSDKEIQEIRDWLSEKE